MIVRHLPNFQRIVVDRYHRRSDADGHLKILQQKVPDAEFELVFDVGDRSSQERSLLVDLRKWVKLENLRSQNDECSRITILIQG